MLKHERVSENEHGFYLKWLRYYLDFCHKYKFDAIKTDRKIKGRHQDRKDKTNQSWRAEYQRLIDEIKIRHYSPDTLKSYRSWIRIPNLLTEELHDHLNRIAQLYEYDII
jgi:hypothetical protein